MRVKLSVLFLFILLPSIAFCQDMNAGLMGFAGIGLSIPTAEKDFAKSYRAGYNLNAAGCYIFNKTYAARLDLQYNNFSFKETDPNYTGKFISYSITGNLLAGDFSRNSSMNPYGFMGLGPFVNSEKISTNEQSISNSVINLGMGLGGGLNVKATDKLSIFTEMQYIFIFYPGIAKGYLTFKMGIAFRK